MKKILLFSAASCIAMAAVGAEPVRLDNAQTIYVSRDGKTVCSDLYGSVFFYDVETGQKTLYQMDETTYEAYTLGQGQCLSATGVAVGEFADRACYVKGGEWLPLNVPNGELTNLANAITPDGTRICGSVGMAKMSIDDAATPMIVPAVWELKEDGTYGDAQVLPYPELDFTGRVPQYVTANVISDNGNTIVGQVVDYTGFLPYLIWYTRSEEGEWTYHLSPESLYNPNHVVFPEWPGEGPAMPQLEDYMTEEEINAYEAAVNQWYADCEESGNWDYSTYPSQEDFVSAEKKAEYDEAMAAYDVEAAAYDEKYEAFMAVYDEVMDEAYPLTFNNVTVSADGKTAASSAIKSQGDWWSGFTYEGGLAVFNLEEGTVGPISNDQAEPMTIAEDGTILCTINTGEVPMYSVVYAPGAGASLPIVDWVAAKNATLAEWMRQNMFHDMEMYDQEKEEFVTLENVNCTGAAHASMDMGVLCSHIENVFDFDSDAVAFSYILPVLDNSGVKKVDFNLEVRAQSLGNGVILVEGAPCTLTVTDLQGRTVFAADNAAGKVNTGLTPGAYVIRANAGKTSVVLKATL